MQVVPVLACVAEIVGQACKYYLEFEPSTTQQQFRAQFVDPIRDMGPQAGERLLTELLKVSKSSELFDATYAPMLIAVGFAAQAVFEDDRGERELGLFALMQANYWCGVMWASRGVREAREKTVSTMHRRIAKKAGTKRYSRLRTHAQEIAVRRFSDGPLLKTSEAAKQMVNDLHRFAAENGLKPVGGKRDGTDDGQKTVENWLRKWADEGLIQLKRQQPRVR
jgi:hypothetical protein